MSSIKVFAHRIPHEQHNGAWYLTRAEMHLCLLFGPSPGLGHVVVSFAVAVWAVSKANMIVAILINDLKRACRQRKSRLISTANNKEKTWDDNTWYWTRSDTLLYNHLVIFCSWWIHAVFAINVSVNFLSAVKPALSVEIYGVTYPGATKTYQLSAWHSFDWMFQSVLVS